MSVRLQSVVFACDDPPRAATFWASLLHRQAVADTEGVTVGGDLRQIGLRLVAGKVQRAESNAVHIHLTSDSAERQQRTVERALALGARHHDVGQRPEEDHVVLADPAGYAFCIIEPDNAYLADTGFLGELACDGSHDVGVFWSAALEWPLVWDQNGETAVQSPAGGTKLAWGGPPVRRVHPVDPPRFELVVEEGSVAAEVDRLIGLGAAAPEQHDRDTAVLADPDGVRFRVRAAGSLRS